MNHHFVAQLQTVLQSAKNPLVLAVGGGNDSVSTLLLQKQLQTTFNYYPEKINVVAMLPDCLDYHNVTPTDHPLLGIINETTTRSVQGYTMNAFPERILSSNKNIVPTLTIENVYGISMKGGSIGVAQALQYLVQNNNFDLILALDVGGDFIAVNENIDVLSPMMDGYMLYALKQLELYQETQEKTITVLYSVFGLGTDGESTPDMLNKALTTVGNMFEGNFEVKAVQPVIDFYRQTVEPNRYSRTTDFTIREIMGVGHDNPAVFRGRFHVKEKEGEKAKIHYGVFEHTQDPQFFAKYYIFNNIDNVFNRFSQPCNNGLEWFLHVQDSDTKINHELNGQAYSLDQIFNDEIVKDKVLFFGTPSRKFNAQQQKEIAEQIYNAIINSVYHVALIYKEQLNEKSTMHYKIINDSLVLIGQDQSLMDYVKKQIEGKQK